ncbi:MAG: hypothetical protein R2702_12835 [Acidimicrobiales bacterium]
MTVEESEIRAALDRIVERAALDEVPPGVPEPARERAGSRSTSRRLLAVAAVVALLGAGAVVVARSRPDDGPDRLATVPAGEDERGGWQQVDDLPVEGITRASAVWTGSELVVLGGFREPCQPDLDCGGGGLEVRPDVTALDPASGRWRRLADLPDAIPRGPGDLWSAVGLAGEVYLWAASAPGARGGALWALAPGEGSWRRVDLPFSGGRGYHLEALGDRLALLAGSEDAGEQPTHAYDPGDGTWTTWPEDPLPRLFDQQLVRVGDDAYLFGKSIADLYGDAEAVLLAARFDLQAGAWHELPPSPSVAYRLWPAGDGRLIAPEPGTAPGALDDDGDPLPFGTILSTATQQWSDLPSRPPGYESGTVGLVGAAVADYPAAGGWMADVRGGGWRWIEVPPAPGTAAGIRRLVADAGGRAVAFGAGDWSGGEVRPLRDVWVWTPPDVRVAVGVGGGSEAIAGTISQAEEEARRQRATAATLAWIEAGPGRDDPRADQLADEYREALVVLDPLEVLDDEGRRVGYWLDRFVTVDEYEPLRAEAEATIERLEAG